MQLIAFRMPGIVAHNYGDGQLVIWQETGDPFAPRCVKVPAKKLAKKLKRWRKACRTSK